MVVCVGLILRGVRRVLAFQNWRWRAVNVRRFGMELVHASMLLVGDMVLERDMSGLVELIG